MNIVYPEQIWERTGGKTWRVTITEPCLVVDGMEFSFWSQTGIVIHYGGDISIDGWHILWSATE